MAQPTIQFQNVLDAINNIQTQLNTLQTQITKIGSPLSVPSTPAHDLLITEGGSFTLLNMPLDTVLFGAGAGADPTATAMPNCADSTHFLSYNTSTHVLSAPVVFNNQGTTTTLLHGNAAGAPSFAGVSLVNDTAANQGTATTVLHGNAAGQPSFSAVNLLTDVTGVLPAANGGVTTLKSAGTTVSSSVSETNVWSFTIAANALGTTGVLIFPFAGKHLNNSGGNSSIRYRVYYGSALLLDSGVLATSSNAAAWPVTGYVWLSEAGGVTNSQNAGGSLMMGPQGTADATWASISFANTFVLNGQTTAAAVDDTASQTFRLTVTLGNSAGTISFTPEPASVLIY